MSQLSCGHFLFRGQGNQIAPLFWVRQNFAQHVLGRYHRGFHSLVERLCLFQRVVFLGTATGNLAVTTLGILGADTGSLAVIILGFLGLAIAGDSLAVIIFDFCWRQGDSAWCSSRRATRAPSCD